VKDENLQMQCN